MPDLHSALGGDLRAVVELASLAPSVHNTQPWRFSWDGAALSVHEDVDRALPVLDPAGRERLISCGAAVLNARLAFADRGHDVRTELCPDPHDPALLARIEVVGRREASEQERALATSIPRRSTDRDPFDDRPVPDDVRARVVAAADLEGAWARFVDDDRSADAVELQVLLSHAADSQRHDPAYLAELAAWRREREAEGIPARALPSVPAELRGSSWALRDFDAAAPAPGAGPAGAEPPRPEHPAVLVIGTTGDDRADWVVAGQAVGRVLLQATAAGLAAQPLTQVLEVPVLRARMRHVLGVVGYPQMLLRLGYGHRESGSPRRPVEDTLRVVEPDAGV